MVKNKTICLVDDEDVFHWIVQGILKKVQEQCEFLPFFNGDQILEYLSQTSNSFPDVILLDLNMPICDGWKFLEGYSGLQEELKSRIQIYIVSSSIDPKDKERAEQHPDVRAFLSKPISIEFLDKVIEEIDDSSK